MRKLISVLLIGLAFTGAFRPAMAQDILISGVVDGPLSGGTPKAVELFVANDIADLSLCGIGSANNGNGGGAEEFTFPAGPAFAGSFIYVASESAQFTSFFGFAPDFTSSAANINGDDAIELFCGGVVVDVFGDINLDGSGQAWEYLDGWAYRATNSGPDGTIFQLGSWTFSGPNALDGETTNATAATPFPIGSYTIDGRDFAPRVVSTNPANGATDVALDISLQITFSETVTVVTGAWFSIVCDASGSVLASESSADGISYTLDPAVDLLEGESCTVSVFADQVSDLDLIPDPMAADFSFSFSALLPVEPIALVINEINADPDTTLGDANGDGTVSSSQDEFVEIVNATDGPLDLSGWSLSDGVNVRHVFANGTVLDQDCAVVVFSGGAPTGDFGFALVQLASSGALGLNNGGDSITLNDGTADRVSESYGSAGGNNQSLTRDPDISGAFVQHSGATGSGGAVFSPGTRIDGTMFSGCSEPVVVPIHDIQGAGSASPFNGAQVLIEGIVTGDFQDGDADTQSNLRGFYVQEEIADADPLTSEGIFVFDGSTPGLDVNAGDRVRVRGLVSEFFGDTQISSSSVEIIGTGSIAATPISFPTVNIVSNVNGQFIPDLEAFEGMLVNVTGLMTVNSLNNLDRFGEMTLSSGGRMFTFTNSNDPDPVNLVSHLQDVGRRSLMLDDGLSIQNPDPIRYPAPGLPNDSGISVRSGDSVSGMVGNIRFSRGSGGSGKETYRLMPVQEPIFSPDNQRPFVTPDVGGTLRVAALNVLNFFTTLDGNGSICGPSGTLGCRGADNVEEFDRQRAKTITAIYSLDVDVIGLVEIENNPSAALQSLVDGLNDIAGPGVYDFINTGTIGTDAIRVALIFNSQTVAPLGDFAVLDSSVDPRFIDTRNRPVLAQSFTDSAGGGIFTVAVNHFKSKGSGCADIGDPNLNDGQGNCNGTRTQAAAALVDWLATDPTGSNDDDFMIIGDLNAYLAEDPVRTLEDAGFENLLTTFVGSLAYSFTFDDQAGALDHALASPGLSAQVTGTQEWHVNVDEPDAFDYNLDFGRNPTLFDSSLPFRGSDHDPVIVGLDLISDIVGDLDKDGDIDRRDLFIFFRSLFSHVGQRRYNADADFDGDGFIGFYDLHVMIDLYIAARH